MIAVIFQKELSKRKVCAVCKVEIIADERSIKCVYWRILSHGGLICPSPPLGDFGN